VFVDDETTVPEMAINSRTTREVTGAREETVKDAPAEPDPEPETQPAPDTGPALFKDFNWD
jgi:hypothetical protein